MNRDLLPILLPGLFCSGVLFGAAIAVAIRTRRVSRRPR